MYPLLLNTGGGRSTKITASISDIEVQHPLEYSQEKDPQLERAQIFLSEALARQHK